MGGACAKLMRERPLAEKREHVASPEIGGKQTVVTGLTPLMVILL